jgi:hypothetical protein
VSQALSRSMEAFPEAISNKIESKNIIICNRSVPITNIDFLLDKRKHRVSASGVATGVNTPPPLPNSSNPRVVVVGTTEMSQEDHAEAKRYFELFQDALKDKYPHGGCSIHLNENTVQCVIKGRKTSDVFKFAFQPEMIKNHYVAFRLVDDFDNYLTFARNAR